MSSNTLLSRWKMRERMNLASGVDGVPGNDHAECRWKGGAVTRVGVALSGGGHRASVWAAGLLLYLADAGRNGDVGVIASVSGGSITNGVVAQEMDYRQARADEVRSGLGPP